MNTLDRRLRCDPRFFAIWTGSAVFLAYFSMYMIRKPYVAHTYEGIYLGDFDYKIILIAAQVIGYALSKIIGISFISQIRTSQRLVYFGGLLTMAWLSLVCFSISSPSWGVFWLFLNGLPLGLIWGIVFTYCEGRKLTEVLTVILSANFILSSGIAKSIGAELLNIGVNYQSMPMIAGLLTLPILILSMWMLSVTPKPSDDEVLSKSQRVPMYAADRRVFLHTYGVIIAILVFIYLILTVVREVRDLFAVEIWSDLGYSGSSSIYTLVELPVALVVLFALAMLYKINDHYRALRVNMIISIAGFFLIIISSAALYYRCGNSVVFMILIGIGLFLPYILFNGIIFDRFIAHYHVQGNVGFIQYIADAVGYMGSISILMFKNFEIITLDWLQFLIGLGVVGGSLCMVFSFYLLHLFKSSVQRNSLVST